MKVGTNALILLIFGLASYAFPTVLRSATRLPADCFNGSVTKGARKSTHPVANDVFRLVIDAGHGGKDPGGMGANSQEKYIALNVATFFADAVRNNFGTAVEVILTRNDDTFIPLYERAAIANRNHADLFVSIHANIMPGSSVTRGTETFVMGQHVADHNLEVAKRENAAVFLEDNYEQHYDYDPNSDEGHILMNMFQHAFLERSILFAELVERQFAAHGRRSRGVKQAGFVVLKETTMPSVLVETGFMSCPGEEAYLLSDAGQRELSRALLLAFTEYYDLCRNKGEMSPVVDQRQWSPRSVASAPVSAPVTIPIPAPVATPEPAPYPLTYSVPVSRGNEAVLMREVALGTDPAMPRLVSPADTVPFRFGKAKTKEYQEENRVPQRLDLSKIPDGEITYALQLVATKGTVDTTTTRWQQLPYPIVAVREGVWKKYQLRGIYDPADMRAAKLRIREAGFKESLETAYYGGKRLTQGQVRYLMQR